MWAAMAMAVLGQAVPVDAKLLDGLAVHSVTLNFHGVQQQCSGPLLADVVKRMGAPSGAELRGDALRIIVMATARDGYRVAYSLGEIDPLLGNKLAIVATSCNGQPLGAEHGPYRLALADETRGARSVRQVATLTLLSAGD